MNLFRVSWAPLLLLLLLHALLGSTQSPWQACFQFLRDVLKGPSDLVRNTPAKELRSQYDFIVIGAGSAGAVVASRLSEIPEWSILLLEAGQDELAFTDIPFMSTVLSSTLYSWNYFSEPQDNALLGLKRRRSKWPKGKGMGGSSIINGMIYNRGHPQDFNNWAALGNPGWSYDDVLPYFLRSENAKGDFENSPWHAKGGFLDVQNVPHKTVLADAFLEAVQLMGYPLIDYNAPDIMGFSLFQATMRGGTRCSTNKAFLRPARDRKNLQVAKFALVTKILIDPYSRRAIGVQFFRDGQYFTVKARKEVILSAGAINTPQLLMLSGVGPKQHLEELKIPVIVDSPGVGQNLQDHVAFSGLSFLVNQPVAITGSSLSITEALKYVKRREGVLTNIGVGEAIGFIRSNIAKTAPNYPDLEIMFGATHLGSESLGLARRHLGMSDDLYEAVYKPIEGSHGWGVFPICLQPESRGWVKLASKSPFKKPLMNGNFLAVQHDLDTIVEGIKFSIELGKTPPFQKYNSTLHAIPYPGCKHLGFGTDAYWECATRYLTTTIHHQCCTAKMGPRADPLAVVDPELRVYGVQGLRVVDASIMPIIPAAHTNAAVIMIGEKASDLIKMAHGKMYHMSGPYDSNEVYKRSSRSQKKRA